jgi:hypothetical protein
LPESIIRFDTGDSYPSYRRQYRVAKHLETVIDGQLSKWLTGGMIAPSIINSPWNSALLIAPKKDIGGNQTGWRVCIDPRHINLLIPDANFPLPLIREILGQLEGAVIYTKIDLKQGFNQFRVHPEDQVKTTFTWKNQQYHFVGAPFGFKNVPSSFQMVISQIFRDLSYVQPYIDDIIIYSNT